MQLNANTTAGEPEPESGDDLATDTESDTQSVSTSGARSECQCDSESETESGSASQGDSGSESDGECVDITDAKKSQPARTQSHEPLSVSKVVSTRDTSMLSSNMWTQTSQHACASASLLALLHAP